jgi:hypothetical protein
MFKNNVAFNLIVLVFIISSCGSSNNPPQVDGTSIVGDWIHEKSRIMGGYKISSKTVLSIIRNGPGDYQYSLKTTIIDEMYGGQPKTEMSNGKLDKEVKEKKWRFSDGNFGERGAYIVVPKDDFNNGKPQFLSIRFSPGRGDAMDFTSL